MNRTEVLERIEPILNLDVKEVEHNPRTRVMVAPDRITFRPGGGSRLMEVSPEGSVALTRFVGLPETVVNRLHPETLGRATTELLERKERYGLLIKSGRVVDFTSPRQYRTLNSERVLRTVESAVAGAEFHRVLTMPNHSATLEIVGERHQPVVVNDMVQAGAMVAFSPIGTIQPFVQSYVLRLSCTNGSTANEVLREFHFGNGDRDNVWQWFRQTVAAAYNSMDRIVVRWRQMIEDVIPADDRAMVLVAMLKEARITGKDAEAVMSRAIAEPPRNSYDIMNLVTWATSHVVQRPERVVQARQAAASFADETQHHRFCPVCRRER